MGPKCRPYVVFEGDANIRPMADSPITLLTQDDARDPIASLLTPPTDAIVTLQRRWVSTAFFVRNVFAFDGSYGNLELDVAREQSEGLSTHTSNISSGSDC